MPQYILPLVPNIKMEATDIFEVTSAVGCSEFVQLLWS
jgi:hypothetical protein